MSNMNETAAGAKQPFGNATDAILRVLAACPDLNSHGHGVYSDWFLTRGGWRPKLAEAREEILREGEIAQFIRACEWLDQAPPPIKTINRQTTSYGWKHVVETWLRDRGAKGDDYYVSNGMFITAALHKGFSIYQVPGTVNVWLNISCRATGGRL